MLARCLMVSICSPDSFAFFIADVARGHPDRLGTRQEMALVEGLRGAPDPQRKRPRVRMSLCHRIRLDAGQGPSAQGARLDAAHGAALRTHGRRACVNSWAAAV